MYERWGSGTRPGRDLDTSDGTRTPWTGPGHPGRGPDTLDGARTPRTGPGHGLDGTRTPEYTRLMSCGFKRFQASLLADRCTPVCTVRQLR